MIATRSGAHRFIPRHLALLIAVLIWIAGRGSAGVASAAEGERADATQVQPGMGGQRSLGFGATVGLWSGMGGIVGGGGERVKGWLSGGYAPVLVFANARTPDKAVRFNSYNAYQVNGDLDLVLAKRARLEVGLLLGYKFNNVIGHGGAAGLGVIYDIGPKVALDISGGLAVFPSARDRLDRTYAYPMDRVPGLTPAIQAGANFGLLFYP